MVPIGSLRGFCKGVERAGRWDFLAWVLVWTLRDFALFPQVIGLLCCDFLIQLFISPLAESRQSAASALR